MPELERLARTIARWETPILRWHRTRLTNAATEGTNLVIKNIKRLGFGFRNFDNYRLRLPQAGGALIATTVERYGRLDIVVNDAGIAEADGTPTGRGDERRLGAGVAGERGGHVERGPRRGTTPTRHRGWCHPQRQPDHGRVAGGVVDPLRRVCAAALDGSPRCSPAPSPEIQVRSVAPVVDPTRDDWSVPWPPPAPRTSPTP